MLRVDLLTLVVVFIGVDEIEVEEGRVDVPGVLVLSTINLRSVDCCRGFSTGCYDKILKIHNRLKLGKYVRIF